MSKCSLTGILIYHCSFTQNTNFAPQYSNCYWLFWVIQSLIAQNGLTIVRGCLSPSKWHFCSPVNGQLNGFMLCRMHHASFCFACHVMCRYKSSFIWEYQNFIGKILTKDNPKTHTETNFSLSESALGLSPLTELHHTAWGAASQDDMKTKAQKCIQYELCNKRVPGIPLSTLWTWLKQTTFQFVQIHQGWQQQNLWEAVCEFSRLFWIWFCTHSLLSLKCPVFAQIWSNVYQSFRFVEYHFISFLANAGFFQSSLWDITHKKAISLVAEHQSLSQSEKCSPDSIWEPYWIYICVAMFFFSF